MTLHTTTSLPQWQRLAALGAALINRPLIDIVGERDRYQHFSFVCEGILVDFSKQRLTDEALRALCALAEQLQLPAELARLMDGAIANTTERRAALHTALRAPAVRRPAAVREELELELARMEGFVDALRDGRTRGFTGRAIRHVVHIGIGGSHLGPEFALDALLAYQESTPRVLFLANIDGHAIAETLRGLDPETTLFIVASKSFATKESLVNATSARSWFLERTGRADAVADHFVAITSNSAAAGAFGIAPRSIFSMWDWVGGRYSLWSAVGLPIAIAIGMSCFKEMLAGAHAMDQHARAAPPERNLPVLLALVGIWNLNILGAQSHAVLTYDRRLRMMPSYLQQLEMESNGKSVRTDGSTVDLQTMPVLWGGEETNAQHAFHQQLHQGNRAFSVDFIACARPAHAHAEHHQWLLANCLAQSEALLIGRAGEGDAVLAAHRTLAGNRPSTTIVLDELTPRRLGALLALYEHKVFCQGTIWQINPFDQWGVELGKVLADAIHPALGDNPAHAHDASTQGLISHLKRQTDLGTP